MNIVLRYIKAIQNLGKCYICGRKIFVGERSANIYGAKCLRSDVFFANAL